MNKRVSAPPNIRGVTSLDLNNKMDGLIPGILVEKIADRQKTEAKSLFNSLK